jgi:DNA ligase (NAD+)
MDVITPVSDIGAPVNCPTCDFKLEVVTSKSGNSDLMCQNKACPAKHIKGWLHYVTQLGGKGIGGSQMEKILKTGKVKNLPDLYHLTLDDLTKDDTFRTTTFSRPKLRRHERRN